MAQLIQSVDWLCSSGRGPVKEAKKFISSSGLSSQSRLNLNRLRSGRGPIEAQRSLAKH